MDPVAVASRPPGSDRHAPNLPCYGYTTVGMRAITFSLIARRAHRVRAPLVPKAMTGGTEGGEVVGVVGAAARPRLDVVDFEKAGTTAARKLALVVVAGQDFAAG